GEKEVLLYDRYDIWKIDVKTGDSVCLTDGYGRANQIVLRNSGFSLAEGAEDRTPAERRFLDETLVLSARDEHTMAAGYFLDWTSGVRKPRRLVMLDKTIGGLRRAKKAERLFFTLSSA